MSELVNMLAALKDRTSDEIQEVWDITVRCFGVDAAVAFFERELQFDLEALTDPARADFKTKFNV